MRAARSQSLSSQTPYYDITATDAGGPQRVNRTDFLGGCFI
jgi:hypothetical protein